MPKVTIDGQSIEVPAGTTILQAARIIGGDIVPPAMCYYSKLKTSGGYCRTCIVKVTQGSAANPTPMPKPVASCRTTVMDGMVVEKWLCLLALLYFVRQSLLSAYSNFLYQVPHIVSGLFYSKSITYKTSKCTNCSSTTILNTLSVTNLKVQTSSFGIPHFSNSNSPKRNTWSEAK